MKIKYYIILVVCLLLLSSCSKSNEPVSSDKENRSSADESPTSDENDGVVPKDADLGGSYNIDEFFSLIAPAIEASKATVDYATEEETREAQNKGYHNALGEIGFKGGEQIVLNGVLSSTYTIKDGGECAFILTNNEKTFYLTVSGKTEDVGWGVLLIPNTNIKIQFTVVVEEKDDGLTQYLFKNAEILSPSKITSEKRNCNPYTTDGEQLVIGRIKDMYTFNYTDQELDDYMFDLSIDGGYNWFSAIKYCSHFAILEDDNGYEVGVFFDEQYLNSEVTFADVIGVRGSVYETPSIEGYDFPKYYVNGTILGGAYKFPVE